MAEENGLKGGIEASIEAWLAGGARQLRLRFPRPLEARFEADTRQERSRTLGRVGFLGCLVGIALFPALVAALPDMIWASWRLYLETSIVVGLVAAAANYWLDPPPLLRESLQWAANVLNALVVTYLFARSSAVADTLYAAGVITLIVYSTIGVPLRFGFSAAAVCAILAAFGLDLGTHSMLPEPVRRDLFLLAAATGGFTLIANWRLEWLQRRGYLLVLRETRRGRDLSLRNRELDELVRCDALTGLANRRAYDAWLTNLWVQSEAEGQTIGLIMLDVDCFKAYNDHYGHPGGDRCLQMVARCLREQLRGTSDLVARLGGEEFAVLLPGLDLETCAEIAERLREAVAALELPHLGQPSAGCLTISGGVASLRWAAGVRSPDLFAAADAALYAAKQSGRNRICLGDFSDATARIAALAPHAGD